ncbi:hypothetical protein V1506DRAFT_174835 [Lipomyces tetrasporus]
MVIVPVKTSDGILLVDWYTTDDPDNPQNWSPWKSTSWPCLFACPHLLSIVALQSILQSHHLSAKVLGYQQLPHRSVCHCTSLPAEIQSTTSTTYFLSM